jgi:predicted Zn finger-like uncharacterized protein
MLLATRCPHCETVFRLQETQLKLRGGLVRCGHCQAVFDASQNIVQGPEGAEPTDAGAAPESGAAATAPASPGANDNAAAPEFHANAWDAWAPAPATDIAAGLRHDIGHAAPQPAAAPSEPPPEPAPNEGAEPVAEPVAEPAAESVAPTRVDPRDTPEPVFAARPEPLAHAEAHERDDGAPPAPGSEPTLASSASLPRWPADPEPHFGTPKPFASESFAADPTGAPHFAVTREARTPEPRRLAWRIVGALIALILGVLLILQLAWWRRETVMVYWPGSQALFTQACARLGCTIAPPRDIDGLQVEASDLRQIDGPHRLELRVPLRNRFNVALAYPALELTLLDDKNNVALRRVLWPEDYVRPGTPIAAGLPARTTQTMIVRLDTGSAVAANFRVQIFYP